MRAQDSRPPDVTYRLCLHLPLHLTVAYWQRHELHESDLRHILEATSAQLLWQCALLLDIHPSNSTIKLTFCSPNAMLVQSKASVVRRILQVAIARRLVTGSSPTLHHTATRFQPHLPLHVLTHAAWTELAGIPCVTHRADPDLFRPLTAARTWAWKDIVVTPLWYDRHVVLCVRLVPWAEFQSSGRAAASASPCVQPLDITVAGARYAGVDELMYFTRDVPRNK
jgi:hypothetical protein